MLESTAWLQIIWFCIYNMLLRCIMSEGTLTRDNEITFHHCTAVGYVGEMKQE